MQPQEGPSVHFEPPDQLTGDMLGICCASLIANEVNAVVVPECIYYSIGYFPDYIEIGR